MAAATINLTDNPAIAGRADRYMVLRVDVARVLEGWRGSLMAHEWFNPDGTLRDIDHLNMLDRDKVLKVRKSLQDSLPLPRPVLGIGLLDNIEIGASRDVFFTLASEGVRTIDVHIPRGNQPEFKPYLG